MALHKIASILLNKSAVKKSPEAGRAYKMRSVELFGGNALAL